jgi:hypothetical protein
MSKSHKVNLSSSEHLYGMQKVYETIFCNTVTTYRPTLDTLLDSMNLKASVGLPTPWVKKRDSIETISLVFSRIMSRDLDLLALAKDLDSGVVPLTAAFVRNQVTNSGLKIRLVFAVSLVFVTVETYFNIILKAIVMNVPSHAIHGFTQLQISALTQTTKDKYTMCIDYSGYDQHVPSYVIISVARLCAQVMCLDHFELRLFYTAINFFIYMPLFHPKLPLTHKVSGIPSGSGLTSLFGSFCNCYMLHVCIRRYCHTYNIKNFEGCYEVFMSSDDTIISSTFYINFDRFNAILTSLFGMSIELESKSKPGVCVVFFLGSKWKEGLPYRDYNRLLARILFGSGNFPYMSELQLLQSRCYEILGNTCEYSKIYQDLGVPYPKRVFRFVELMDYNAKQQAESIMTGYERRGYFTDIAINSKTADSVWMSR